MFAIHSPKLLWYCLPTLNLLHATWQSDFESLEYITISGEDMNFNWWNKLIFTYCSIMFKVASLSTITFSWREGQLLLELYWLWSVDRSKIVLHSISFRWVPPLLTGDNSTSLFLFLFSSCFQCMWKIFLNLGLSSHHALTFPNH